MRTERDLVAQFRRRVLNAKRTARLYSVADLGQMNAPGFAANIANAGRVRSHNVVSFT